MERYRLVMRLAWSTKQSKFQDSQGYTEKLSGNKPKTIITNNKNQRKEKEKKRKKENRVMEPDETVQWVKGLLLSITGVPSSGIKLWSERTHASKLSSDFYLLWHKYVLF